VIPSPDAGANMERSSKRYLEFEKLVADIFRAEGFEVAENYRFQYGSTVYEVDLLLVSKTQATAVVEVKLFRTLSLPTDILLQVATRIEHVRQRLRRDRAVFVTSARIPLAHQRAVVSDSPRLAIYDHDSLKALAAKYPDLALRLEELFRETLIRSDAASVLPIEETTSTKILTEPSDTEAIAEAPIADEEITKGKALCSQLHAVKSGRKESRKFESAVEAALRYIFATDLVSWSSQKVTDTGMSRYDLIARVSSKDDVWQMIKDRFHSQYVIFECKNYVDPIRQGEIYTTEKYLHQKALRGVAFIISRKGAHESALSAARGALREHGKLIVNLSVDDVCEMLALKDATQDHNGFLFDKVDDMLMKLER
jgi:Holliday junction resolvase-like predicted endonuclease